MLGLLLQMIVMAVTVGFAYWAYTLLIPIIPLPSPFKELVNALVPILCAAIVVFYAVIPLLQAIGRGMLR